jgi:hypothetical protein
MMRIVKYDHDLSISEGRTVVDYITVLSETFQKVLGKTLKFSV